MKRVFNAPRKRMILSKMAGWRIVVSPDRERLINRLFLKGYCEKDEFPKEIPWLSCLEPFMIIERFNSVIRDFANFYAEFISNKRYLNRCSEAAKV